MKKYFVFFSLLINFSNVSLFTQPSFPGGPGDSKDNAYELWTKDHFIELGDSIMNSFPPNDHTWHYGKHFRLMQDIGTITEITYPIGLHFHGGGKKIFAEIMGDYPNNNNWALFNSVTTKGNIDSLILSGIVNYRSSYAGIVASIMFHYGLPPSSVSNCINNATITSMGVAAGIAYSNNRGAISHCINNGPVNGFDNVAGIASQNIGATITGCINTGKITATNSGSDLWGICGMGGIAATSGGSISSCINLGAIEGQRNVAGIVGDGPGGTITNNINSGYIKGINGVGGVVGNTSYLLYVPDPVTISNCINTGVVEGDEDVGAIVGKEP